jgi:hypothetical protein
MLVRCLTLRSSRPSTAGNPGRVALSVILHHAAKAACLRGRLNSNVRQRNYTSVVTSQTRRSVVALVNTALRPQSSFVMPSLYSCSPESVFQTRRQPAQQRLRATNHLRAAGVSGVAPSVSSCRLRALPNPSVKPTRNIRPHRPRGTCSNLAPRGRRVLLSRAAYLER